MRRWSSLIAALVDLIDWRRWNLTPDQGRDIILRAPLVGRGVFSPAAVQGPARELMDISNQIDREWRDLLSSEKLRIEGINPSTGVPVSLPGAVAAMAAFSFGPGVLVLPGADGACVLVAAVIEQSAGAPPPKRTPIAEGEPDRPKQRGGWQQSRWLRARDAAMEWLADNGCPDPGDGNQATLERYIASWLEERGYQASEPTVRRHVSRWIKESRAELA